jgi:hypothetical protein
MPGLQHKGAMQPPFFDPSKMDPKALLELSNLVRELPPEKIQKMQTLMHNMMAGHDVSKQMAEFEQSLPPGFREKLMSLLAGQGAAFNVPQPSQFVSPGPASPQAELQSSQAMDLREARLTILRAVSEGQLSPEDAERLLFKE